MIDRTPAVSSITKHFTHEFELELLVGIGKLSYSHFFFSYSEKAFSNAEIVALNIIILLFCVFTKDQEKYVYYSEVPFRIV